VLYSQLIESDDEAARAARIISVDYADALTGFEFRGRQGTAVLKGIVVAIEYGEAVEAVIEAFRDERAQAEADQKALKALRLWKRFMIGLRIKERVDGYEIEGEEPDTLVDAEIDDGDEYVDDGDGGGGFFPE
jgi:xeroderma pigmentosum group C-complementing protein